MRRMQVLGSSAVLALLVAGCSNADGVPAAQVSTPAAVVTSSAAAAPVQHTEQRQHRAKPRVTVTPDGVVSTPVPSPTLGRFRWRSSPVTAASLGDSWHQGCPVGPSGLRALSISYWGFDHARHQGTLIVASGSVSDYVAAFRAIYAAKFPIRQMVPVSAYGGSDVRSMAHDNTSAFNCRYAVSNGPKHWSMHAYGGAVDINPRENPYRLNGEVLPPDGKPYMDRSNVRPGMIVEGSSPVRAFATVGWGWGGRWASTPDYQHFSSTGG